MKRIKEWKNKLSLIGIICLLIMTIIIPITLDKYFGELWINLSSNIGIAIFSTLSISKYLNKEAEKLISVDIPLLLAVNRVGILQVVSNESRIQMISELIQDYHSETLSIVMNDGRGLFSTNGENLNNWFRLNGKTTIFILLKPESDAVRLLEMANGKQQGVYQNKIQNCLSEIETYKNKYPNHNFKIFLYEKGYLRNSIILNDTRAIIGFYRNSPGKKDLPLHFLISNTGKEFKAIQDDVEELKKLSRQYSL